MFRIASHGRYVAMAALLLAATSTQAGFTENFSYGVGNNLVGQGNPAWTNVQGSGNANTMTIENPGTPLQVGSIMGDNQALRITGNRTVQRQLNPVATDAIEVSFLFRYIRTNQQGSTLNEERNDFASIIFSNNAITAANNDERPNIGFKANEDSNTGTNDFFIRFTGTGGTFATLDLTPGTDYLISGLFYKGTGSNTYNKFDLSVTDGSTTATASISLSPNQGLSSVGFVGIRGANLNNNTAVFIDNLNVNVVPVPPALALVAMGVGPLAGWHFLRRRKTAAA